jgi:hypothetical protein
MSLRTEPVPFYKSIAFGVGSVSFLSTAATLYTDFPGYVVWILGSTGLLCCVGHFTAPYAARLFDNSMARDLAKFQKASKQLDEVCRTIEVYLAQFDHEGLQKGAELSAFLMEKWPPTLCPLWRHFTDAEEITVCVRQLDPNDDSQLVTLQMCPTSLKRAGAQPERLPIAITIGGRAYRERKIVIVPRLRDDPDFPEIQKVWPDILDHIGSVVAAPVWVRRMGAGRGKDYVAAILQIDSPDENVFRNTSMTQLLVKLCAHKLGLIIQLGQFTDAILDSKRSRSGPAPSHSDDGGADSRESDFVD